jgi:hypothetical protein
MPKPRLGKGLILAALCLLGAEPASANFVPEPTFAVKMERATLVVIGTVTAIDRGGNVTLSVLQRLKGQSADIITVGTYSRIPEMRPDCCDVGATYLMFLAPVPKTSLCFFGQPKPMEFHRLRHHRISGFPVKQKSGHKSGHKWQRTYQNKARQKSDFSVSGVPAAVRA